MILRSMKAQEIADLNSRLTLRNDEIADYRRKLDGKTPDEAKDFVEALEMEVAVEAEPPTPASAPAPPAVARPRARPAPRAVAEARVFLSRDEYEIARAKTEGMTSLQAAQELQNLNGKWRELRGPLFDVRQSSGRILVFVRGDGAIIGCRFDPEWADRLSRLRVGEEITLIGRIRGFHGVRLESCELVDPAGL